MVSSPQENSQQHNDSQLQPKKKPTVSWDEASEGRVQFEVILFYVNSRKIKSIFTFVISIGIIYYGKFKRASFPFWTMGIPFWIMGMLENYIEYI